MSDFLKQMARSSAVRAAAIGRISPGSLDRPAFPLVLHGFDLIAELKDRSPAEGLLASAATGRVERALLYADGGAAAISVLTEPDRFDGELVHLADVAEALAAKKIPVMRKDFLVATKQILEAKAAGASGVLLIAALLDDRKLASMLDCAFEHDLFVLLESFDKDDLARSAKLLESANVHDQAGKNNFLVGINTRNLRTLAVEPQRLKDLAALLPAGVVAVAESGQRTATDVANVAAIGYRMALVGSALMKDTTPATLIRKMLDAGRDRVAA
jgi:indole-3-glycerol phosphate synthase